MNEGKFFPEPRTEQSATEQEQVMRDIERNGVASALRMLANLNELRTEGLEPSEDVKEALALLKHQIDTYLGDLEK